MRLLLAVFVSIATTVAPVWADNATDNYASYCARCHGDTGQGDGPSVATLKNKPQNLTRCDWMRQISDDTIFKAIKRGGGSVGLSDDMPDWSNDLSDDEIHELVKFVRAFCKKR
jgi:mono/diheme cytochrome c family protein